MIGIGYSKLGVSLLETITIEKDFLIILFSVMSEDYTFSIKQ